MPESSPTPRGHKEPEDSSASCSDSSSGSDADGEDESSSITQEKFNRPERSSEFFPWACERISLSPQKRCWFFFLKRVPVHNLEETVDQENVKM